MISVEIECVGVGGFMIASSFLIGTLEAPLVMQFCTAQTTAASCAEKLKKVGSPHPVSDPHCTR